MIKPLRLFKKQITESQNKNLKQLLFTFKNI